MYTFSNNVEHLWKPQFYSRSANDSMIESKAPDNSRVITGVPLCERKYLLDPSETFYILDSGDLYFENNIFNSKEYCIDNFFVGGAVNERPLMCYKEPIKVEENGSETLVIALSFVSIAFLIITLVIYVLTRELRKKIHGKILICYISSLLLGYITLVVIQLASGHIFMIGCKILGKNCNRVCNKINLLNISKFSTINFFIS